MSKHFYLLGILGIFLVANANAAVGTNNFVLKVGGGLDASLMKAKPGNNFPTPDNGQVYSHANLLGGNFTMDLGYQYFNVSGASVHGIDVLGSFGFSAESIRTPNFYVFVGSLDPFLQKMYVSLSSTYSAGRQFANSKFMVDVLGVTSSFGNIKGSAKVMEVHETEKVEFPGGGFWSIGLNLPLGFQFVMNNGFVFGFRHSLSFLFPAYNTEGGFNLLKGDRSYNFLNYQLNVSLGFMVGK